MRNQSKNYKKMTKNQGYAWFLCTTYEQKNILIVIKT